MQFTLVNGSQMKRERDWDNCCGKSIRYKEEPTGEIKPRTGQEEARFYIGHGEYIGIYIFGEFTFFNCKFDFATAEIVISYTLKYALPSMKLYSFEIRMESYRYLTTWCYLIWGWINRDRWRDKLGLLAVFIRLCDKSVLKDSFMANAKSSPAKLKNITSKRGQLAIRHIDINQNTWVDYCQFLYAISVHGKCWRLLFSWTNPIRDVRYQWCSGGATRGNAVPPLFSQGERDPSLFCSISGIFSAEINEQRRLQDSQFFQMLTYWTAYLLEPFAVSQIYLYMLQTTNSYV